MSKHNITFFFTLLAGICCAQQNYLCFDQSVFALKLNQSNNGFRFNRFEGKHSGGSVHLNCDEHNSFGIGMGLSQISYQKEWRGNIPDTNLFGIAEVNGKISYWSFPISYSWISGTTRRHYRCGINDRDAFRGGLRTTFTPSFLGKSDFSVNTKGGADPAFFLSTFHSSEQHFQHSLTVGLISQFYLLEKRIRLGLEPYAGIGSGYFKESGTNLTTFSYGLRISIGLRAKLPRIGIEKELDPGDAEEKKKQLEQKQKEIEEQLKNNKPNN